MGGMYKIINSKSRTFLAFCFSFVIGIAVFTARDWEDFWLFRLYIIFFLLLSLLVFIWHKKEARWAMLFLLCFTLAGLRALSAAPADSDAHHVKFYNGEKVNIIGYVSSEPNKKTAEVQYVLKPLVVKSGSGRAVKVRGKVLLNLPSYSEFQYGDELNIACLLSSPRNAPDGSFNYERYLAGQGVYSICRNGSAVKSGGRGGNFFLAQLWKIKRRVSEQTERLWPPPASGLMAGLLYGERSGLPKDLEENFSRTGISHIIAVSGYNISIVASFMMLLLLGVGFYRRQAFWLAVVGVAVFVIFVGASASVARAGIMGIVVLVGQYLGRPSRVLNALTLAAAAMLIANPLILLWDAGFQLSFLSTLGLLYLSPVLQKKTGQTVAATLSAIAFTLPLMLWQFGRVALLAPLANIMILWLIPYLMLGGFLALLFSGLLFVAGQALAWIVWVGLRYVIAVGEFFGSGGWASVEWQAPLWLAALLYVLLFFLMRFALFGKKR